ncbi:DUF6576 domain-containing protein, partial [Candidatus Hydrogenedentota bacterium]
GSNVAYAAHLSGMGVAWLYMRRMEGLGRLIAGIKSKIHKPIPTPGRDIGLDEYIRTEVDPILDKAAKHGIHSLTRREKAILRKASSKHTK